MKNKKRLSIIALALGVFAFAYAAIALLPRTANYGYKNEMMKEEEMPILIAHGGGNKEFPDNTLEAFYNAYSVDENVMMETDVSITKDGVVILSHDTTIDRKTEFEELFYEMLMEYNKKKIRLEDYNEFLIIKSLFETLFFIFFHDNYYQKGISKPNERMHEIVKYINNNYQNPITIQKIAYDFGITKDHLCHIFPKYMGVTFVTYLNTVRIKAACDILKKEKDSILEISNKCGFSSSHYFCKVFKKEKGMTPREYRAQFKLVSSRPIRNNVTQDK